MKKIFFLLPFVALLSGCFKLSTEEQRLEKEYQKKFEQSGLIGTSYYSQVTDDIKGDTNFNECGITITNDFIDGSLKITGTKFEYYVDLKQCEPYLSNLDYYIKHGKTKAAQDRDDAWEQEKLKRLQEQEEKAKESEVYAKEQYRFARKSKNTKERIDHLTQASIHGNPQASYELFRYYLPVNEYLADEYLKKAAFDGHAQANLIMGGRFAKSAKYRFGDNVHAYVFYKQAQRYGSKEAATLAKGISAENRFKAQIQRGNLEAKYLWENAQRAASFDY